MHRPFDASQFASINGLANQFSAQNSISRLVAANQLAATNSISRLIAGNGLANQFSAQNSISRLVAANQLAATNSISRLIAGNGLANQFSAQNSISRLVAANQLAATNSISRLIAGNGLANQLLDPMRAVRSMSALRDFVVGVGGDLESGVRRDGTVSVDLVSDESQTVLTVEVSNDPADQAAVVSWLLTATLAGGWMGGLVHDPLIGALAGLLVGARFWNRWRGQP